MSEEVVHTWLASCPAKDIYVLDKRGKRRSLIHSSKFQECFKRMRRERSRWNRAVSSVQAIDSDEFNISSKSILIQSSGEVKDSPGRA